MAVLVLVGAKFIGSEIEKRRLEISLEEALRQGEGQAIEFKERISTENLPPAISAFANTNPGVIFVGVRDNREVCGVIVSNPQEEERVKQKLETSFKTGSTHCLYPASSILRSTVKKCSGFPSRSVTANHIWGMAWCAGKFWLLLFPRGPTILGRCADKRTPPIPHWHSAVCQSLPRNI
jgi:hypothetical protein